MDYEKYGLNAPSTIMVEQPMTVEISRLSKYIGKIDDMKLLSEVCNAMGI